MQTQVGGAGSPASGAGSPGSPGGEKLSRVEAKKLFKQEVDLLIQAVKLIPVYADAFTNLKRTEKLTIQYNDPNGVPRSYQIGRSEFKEFVAQIVLQMKKLPTVAFTLNKTRRRTAPNSGFLAPARFTQDIVNFFANANVGPLVNGNMVVKTDKAGNMKNVPESKSLQPVANSRLNQVLYFTQPQVNGQQNPLFGIISPGTLTPLFALHAYYSGMQNREDATRLSASQEMRQALAGVMRRTIETDVRTISEKYRNNAGMLNDIQQRGQQLIQAITNPGLQVNNRVGPEKTADEIFNPNFFLYAHFSKLISNGKAEGDQALTEQYLASIRQQIPRVYGQNIPGIQQGAFQAVDQAYQRQVALAQQGGPAPGTSSPPYENVVLQAQQTFVALARAYKNQIQGAEQRRRRAAEKAQERAAQQAAAAQTGNIQGISMAQGLPGVSFPGVGGQGLQGLPGVGVQG